PGIRAEIHTLMNRLWHETQMTVVMVTHDIREAFTLATRVVAFDRRRDRPEEKERHGRSDFALVDAERLTALDRSRP
ncbi:hypothetical protein ACC706_38845, partial [Rhizobium johnstonii]